MLRNQEFLDDDLFKFFIYMEDLASIRRNISSSKKIVMTNGCFDLLHTGHLHSLKESRKLGDYLIVVVNSDQSIRKLKGPGRPICNEVERMQLLCAIYYVDYVVLCHDTDMCNTLRLIHPTIWTKGSDRNLQTLNQDERSVAEELGIKINFIENKPILSTSNIINRILEYSEEGVL